MIEVHDSIDCCGISELTPIQDYKNNPEQAVKEACVQIFENGNTSAFLIFSDTGHKVAGNNLAKYIKQNRLGAVSKTKPAINPNSKHSLQVWIWKINQSNLRKYWKNNRITTKKIYE